MGSDARCRRRILQEFEGRTPIMVNASDPNNITSIGISRESLVEGFKKGECPENGFHVHFTGMGESLD